MKPVRNLNRLDHLIRGNALFELDQRRVSAEELTKLSLAELMAAIKTKELLVVRV